MTNTICPGCGLILPTTQELMDADFNASSACRQKCYELSYFTLSLGDPYFVHQLVVDTYAAQHYGSMMKPITITFALVGLYLVNEHNYTGKQVQEMHIELAKHSKEWPIFTLPKQKAEITVVNALRVSDGIKVEEIKRWCADVWRIWKSEQKSIDETIRKYAQI